ncbi:unnamed protein product [Musa acuminata var. zebrina]
MATYEQDSEVYRWGIDFFHGEFFPNPSYSGSTAEQDSSLNGNSYIRQDASATAHEYEEHTQASFFTHDLFDPYCSSGIKDVQEEMDDTKPSSSCSSPARNSYEEGYSLDVTDEFSFVDGEVGRRLNQMVPVPHVPKINGEIPSVDEATSDHQRLLERLQLYDLVERKVQGDGNCQFRALSDQLYRTPEHHEFVRQQIIAQLKSHPEIYEGYVPMTYGEYLNKLSKLGEWGDHVTLQAAADSCMVYMRFPFSTCFLSSLILSIFPIYLLYSICSPFLMIIVFVCLIFIKSDHDCNFAVYISYKDLNLCSMLVSVICWERNTYRYYGVKIFVITSFKDTCYIEILPSVQKSNRVIFLSFWAEVHYNSIYPEGDLPMADTKKKKKWWKFGNKH